MHGVWVLIKVRLLVEFFEKIERHFGDGDDWHSEDDSQEAKKIAADHQSDQHPHWVEVKAASEQSGGEVITFHALNNDEDSDNSQNTRPSGSIQGHKRK